MNYTFIARRVAEGMSEPLGIPASFLADQLARAAVFPIFSAKENTMSAVNSDVRCCEAGALFGWRTSRPDYAQRKAACILVSGGRAAQPRHWNWFDRFRFYVFG
jgi:hypothetical protein